MPVGVLESAGASTHRRQWVTALHETLGILADDALAATRKNAASARAA
jgi:hypothetical protein